MKKKLSILFVLMIFSIIALSMSVVSTTEYLNIGGEDGQSFSSDVSYWNTGMITDSFSTRNLNTPRGSPLVADLDGDGTNEIIVLDDDTIILYESQDLLSVDSVELETQIAGNYYSNMIAFDIDGDNNTEIIVAQEHNQNLTISEYNGTHFFIENSFDLTGTYQALDGAFPERSGTCILGCGDVNECLIVCTNKNRYVINNKVTSAAFNSTGIRQTGTVLKTSGLACEGHFPKVPIMTYTDYDNDGTDEFIFSYYFEINGVYQGHVSTVSVNSSGHVLEDFTSSFTVQGYGLDADSGRYGYPYLSSPLVMDFRTSTSTDEIIIGYQDSTNTYKLLAFNANGAELDNYPAIANTDGEIISNPFRASANEDTGYIDVCIAGIDDDERTLSVLCASYESDALYSNYQYEYGMAEDLYNLTVNNDLAIISGSSIETLQTNDFSEIVLPYGIFRLDKESCIILTGFCNLNRIYINPIDKQGVLIVVDVEQVGREDLLYLTETGLYYIDDGFTNQQAYLDNTVTIDPCANSQSIKLNETLRVTFTAVDKEGDQINATGILYKGEGLGTEQIKSSLGPSGTPFTMDFIAWNLTTESVLELQIRDTLKDHQDNPYIKNYTFSVTTNGVEFGSGCVDNFYYTAPVTEDGEEGDVCTSDSDCLTNYFCGADGLCHSDSTNSENAINTGIDEMSSWTGLSPTLVFLLILSMIIYGLFMDRNASSNPALVVGGVICIIFLGAIIGTKMGFIGVGTLIALILLGIIVAGTIFSRMLFQSAGGN